MRIKVITYTGNGGSSQAITGVGFNPDFILIKSLTDGSDSIFRTSNMAANYSLHVRSDLGSLTSAINSNDTDGFTVGNDSNVNSNGMVYQALCLKDDGKGDLKIFTYTGNGTDNHAITGIGFSPDFVFTKGNTNNTGAYRFALAVGSSNSQVFFGAGGQSWIHSIDSDGFTTDQNGYANNNGIAYYGIAIKNYAGIVKAFQYTGDGTSSRSIKLSFQPAFVWLKHETGDSPVFKGKGNSSLKSQNFDGSEATSAGIETLDLNGFTIDSNSQANTTSGNYFALAFVDESSFGGTTASDTRNARVKGQLSPITFPSGTQLINESFQSAPSGTLKGSPTASYDGTNKWVKFTDASNSQNGQLEYSGITIPTNFVIQTDIQQGNAGSPGGADANFVYWGNSSTQGGEDDADGGYVVAVDEYEGQIQLRFNGASLATAALATNTIANGARSTLKILVTGTRIQVFYRGVSYIDFTDSARTLPGQLVGIGARTGGVNCQHLAYNFYMNSLTGTRFAHTAGSAASVASDTRNARVKGYNTPISSLADKFDNGTTIDPQWTIIGGGVNQGSGVLTIVTNTSSGYNDLRTTTAYDMTGAEAKVQLVNVGNQSLTSLEAILYVQKVGDGTNKVYYTITGNTLQARKIVSGTNTQIASIAFNIQTMRVIRIRESGGTTYFDYSSDGINFTNLTSVANVIVMSNVQVAVEAGNWQSEASSSAVSFDNFNVPSVNDFRNAHTKGLAVGSDTRNAHTHGVSVTNDTRNAHVKGGSGATVISDTRNAHTHGVAVTNSTRNAHTHGVAVTADTRSGHTKGLAVTNNTRNAHVKGLAVTSDVRNAHTKASNLGSDVRNAHTHGVAVTNNTRNAHVKGLALAADTRNAHTKGVTIGSATKNAHTKGSALANDTRNAHVKGTATIVSDTRNAHTHGVSVTADTRNAHTKGLAVSNSTRNAHTKGLSLASDTRNARTHGVSVQNDSRAAHTHGMAISSDLRSGRVKGQSVASSTHNAHTKGLSLANDSRNARTHGLALLSDTRSGRTHGVAVTSDTRNAHTHGSSLFADLRNAHTHGLALLSSFIFGRTHGVAVTSSTRNAHLKGGAIAADSRRGHMLGTGWEKPNPKTWFGKLSVPFESSNQNQWYKKY